MTNLKTQGIVALALSVVMLVAAFVGPMLYTPDTATPDLLPAAPAAVEGISVPGAKAGTYTASAKGFGGDIVATVTVESETVTAITCAGDAETPGLGGKAVEDLPAAMMTAKSFIVDAQSGATISSKAIFTAVNDAMAQAGVENVIPMDEADAASSASADAESSASKAEEPAPAAPAADAASSASTDAESSASKAEEPAPAAPAADAASSASADAESSASADAEAAPAKGIAAPGAKDGTYTATTKGFHGDITVTVTVEGETVTAIACTGAQETPGLGLKAVEELPAQMLEGGTFKVDAQTGATISSKAIFTALNDAMAQAGVENVIPMDEADAASSASTDAESSASKAEEPAPAPAADAESSASTDAESSASKAAEETAAADAAAAEAVAADASSSASADAESSASKAEEAAAAADAAEEAYAPVPVTGATDGVYTASEKGFGGQITATVTIEGGAITKIELSGPDETPSLGGVAVEKLPGKMMKAGKVEVDGVSGATVSSKAIITAVTAALAEAGVDASAMTGVEAAAVVKTEETVEADVVIVGAGGAGMTAAITAKQAGKNVVVLEKMPYVGGNTSKASGGMNAAGTKNQAAAIAAETDEKVKASLEGSTVENFIADTMEGGHQINDIALVTTMAEKSSDAIDWLESIGAPLPTIAATGGTVHMYLHEPEDGSAVGDYLVSIFSKKLTEMEIPLYLETTATELITDENGSVVGVKAESEDKNYTFKAGAVILATGGFGANEEMYCGYRPDLKGTVTTNAPGATGDGIVMAQALGAALVDIEQIQLHPTVFQENGFLVSERLRSNGAILVNKNGQRFVNDLSTRDVVSQAELKQPDACAYIVYDSRYAEEKLYKKYVTNGLTVEGATLEELAANLGFDETATKNFLETVAKWNDVVNNGTEDEFGRNNGLVACDVAPFFAIQIAPGIHHTMGGLKINTATEVLTADGTPIPGLFAAGEVTGGVHGGNRIGGNAVADIVVYGKIAGENACAYADAR